MQTVDKYCIIFMLWHTTLIGTFDNAHFYRASYLWPEPRIEQNWLTTIDVSFGGGTTGTGRNSDGKKVPLLDIYGPQNIATLAQNVPNLNPTNPIDGLLIALAALGSNGTFGKMSVAGKFHILESMVHLYQNLIHGFFIHAHLPIRILQIRNIGFTDISPETGFPNKTTPLWQEALNSLDLIFERLDLSIKDTKQAGVGDFTVLAGWTWNYQETKVWDYIDVTGQWGILAPTGRKKNIDHPFDLPLGYNGYWGIPISFDASAGILDWLTLGMHIGALFLLNKTSTERIQTANTQSGFIKAATAQICIDPGTVWQTSFYTKADHIARGFSCIIGYSFNTQDRSIIEASSFVPQTIRKLNKDPERGHWRMHTVHVGLEYDFAYTKTDKLPHLGIWCNIVVGGMRIFQTCMTTPYLGVDFSWCF